MQYFKIEYGCGCGPNTEEYIIADSLKDAEKQAYHLAVEDYESYAGYHGIPSIEEVAEDMFNIPFDELTEDEMYDAKNEYYQQMESWISYGATKVTKKEYDEEKDN